VEAEEALLNLVAEKALAKVVDLVVVVDETAEQLAAEQQGKVTMELQALVALQELAVEQLLLLQV
jgi:hypothetical protein